MEIFKDQAIFHKYFFELKHDKLLKFDISDIRKYIVDNSMLPRLRGNPENPMIFSNLDRKNISYFDIYPTKTNTKIEKKSYVYNNCHSEFFILIVLNDDFLGGETVLFYPEMNKFEQVDNRNTSAIIYSNKIEVSIKPVIKGHKKIVIIPVLYHDPKSEYNPRNIDYNSDFEIQQFILLPDERKSNFKWCWHKRSNGEKYKQTRFFDEKKRLITLVPNENYPDVDVTNSKNRWIDVENERGVFIILKDSKIYDPTLRGRPPKLNEDFCTNCYEILSLYFNYDHCPNCKSKVIFIDDAKRNFNLLLHSLHN